MPTIAMIGLLLLILAPMALAQTNYNPPSVLPGDDYNIGGYGDACVGLAGMIRDGTVGLRQIPCFIKYFSQTLIAIAGSLSVIFVMVGGYRYTIGGDEGKEEGKRTIQYALIGLAVSLLAWILVDIVLQLATD
jgi:hypothetical protein